MPVNILRLFEVAQRRDLDIHPAALRLVTRHLKLVKALGGGWETDMPAEQSTVAR